MTSTLNATTHQPRIRMDKVSPEVYEAMMALSIASAKDVEAGLAELIKIRASQLNHCAFCLDMHTHDARKQGETEQRIYLLNAWAEAGDIYTEREKAALALTEEATVLSAGEHVSDATYARAAAQFTERELGQIIGMILTINAWNRIAVTTRNAPPRRG